MVRVMQSSCILSKKLWSVVTSQKTSLIANQKQQNLLKKLCRQLFLFWFLSSFGRNGSRRFESTIVVDWTPPERRNSDDEGVSVDIDELKEQLGVDKVMASINDRAK